MFKWCVLLAVWAYLSLAFSSIRAQEPAAEQPAKQQPEAQQPIAPQPIAPQPTAPQPAATAATVHVSASGEIGNPGSYELPVGSSVNELLKVAGGLTEMASDTVHVSHTDETGRTRRYAINLKDARADEPGWLREGDTLLVSRASQFSIAGEVVSPGTYRLDASMTIVEAIQKAGGLTEYGGYGAIVVQRNGSDGKTQTIRVTSEDFVEPDDLIRVKIKLF